MAVLKGKWVTDFHKKVAMEVACPLCRASRCWPCTTASGKDSSTAHADRVRAYYDEVYVPWECPKCGKTARVNPNTTQPIYCTCGNASWPRK